MYLTIDVGGTKTLLAVFNSEGKIEKQQKFPTPKDYNQFIGELRNNIEQICAGGLKPTACSVALPGIMNRETGIVFAFGNLDWENINISEKLQDILTCPIYIENDANLAGLAEAHSLLGEFRKVLYVTISTGIGGVYVIDGVMDPDTIDAEIGHTLFEYKGRLTRWEDFASGKAIVAQTGKMASEITDPADWYLVARNIAVGLINAIATLTPECVVLGGGVGSHLEKFKEKLQEELETYDDKLITLPEIRKAQHPEEAVVYGGYLLCKQHAQNQQ